MPYKLKRKYKYNRKSQRGQFATPPPAAKPCIVIKETGEPQYFDEARNVFVDAESPTRFPAKTKAQIAVWKSSQSLGISPKAYWIIEALPCGHPAAARLPDGSCHECQTEAQRAELLGD